MYARGESRGETLWPQNKEAEVSCLFTSNCSVRVQHSFSNFVSLARHPGPAGMDPGLALMIASVFKVATRVRRSVAVTAVAASLLGGCAVNDTGASEVWDPIETPNRF